MYVRHHFKKLTKRNIELAFRRKTVVSTGAGIAADAAKSQNNQLIRDNGEEIGKS